MTSIRHLLPQAGVRVRTTTAVDAVGAVAAGAEHRVAFRTRLEQRSTQSSEIAAGSATESSGWVAFAEPSLDVRASDVVEIDGRRFEVTADPYLVHGRSGPHHYELRLTAV